MSQVSGIKVKSLWRSQMKFRFLRAVHSTQNFDIVSVADNFFVAIPWAISLAAAITDGMALSCFNLLSPRFE